MTFCSFYEDCLNKADCRRPLTQEVKQAAEEWMNDAPIAQFAEKPSCHEMEERRKNEYKDKKI